MFSVVDEQLIWHVFVSREANNPVGQDVTQFPRLFRKAV
jgi:hypothetical protein